MQFGMTLGAYALPLLISISWIFDIYVLASIKMPYISVEMHYRPVEMHQDAKLKQKTVLTVSGGNWSHKIVNITLIYPLTRSINNIGMSHD